MSPVTVFSFLQSNLRQDMNPFCLHFVFLCWSLVHSLELSNFNNISAQRFVHGPTKLDNKMINTISHHGNWVILREKYEPLSPSSCRINSYTSTLKKRLKTERGQMTKMGVIKSVSLPTEWVNSLIIVVWFLFNSIANFEAYLQLKKNSNDIIQTIAKRIWGFSY